MVTQSSAFVERGSEIPRSQFRRTVKFIWADNSSVRPQNKGGQSSTCSVVLQNRRTEDNPALQFPSPARDIPLESRSSIELSCRYFRSLTELEGADNPYFHRTESYRYLRSPEEL